MPDILSEAIALANVQCDVLIEMVNQGKVVTLPDSTNGRFVALHIQTALLLLPEPVTAGICGLRDGRLAIARWDDECFD